MKQLICNIFEAVCTGMLVAGSVAVMLFVVSFITKQFYLIEPPIIKYVLYGISSVTFLIDFIYLQIEDRRISKKQIIAFPSRL